MQNILLKIFTSFIIFILFRSDAWGFFIEKKWLWLESNGEGFLMPNEDEPIKASEIWKEMPKGIYFSVGSERGLLSAGYSDNITHLVMFDFDGFVVNYNRMNILMIYLSKNFKDYQWLRFGLEKDYLKKFFQSGMSAAERQLWTLRLAEDKQKRFEEIVSRAKKSADLAIDKVKFISNRDHFEWFLKEQWQGWKYEGKNQAEPFYAINYTREEKQYNKLAKMAAAGFLDAEILDITDSRAVIGLIKRALRKHPTCAAIDSSNIDSWGFGIPDEKIAEFLLKNNLKNTFFIRSSKVKGNGIRLLWQYGSKTALEVSFNQCSGHH